MAEKEWGLGGCLGEPTIKENRSKGGNKKGGDRGKACQTFFFSFFSLSYFFSPQIPPFPSILLSYPTSSLPHSRSQKHLSPGKIFLERLEERFGGCEEHQGRGGGLSPLQSTIPPHLSPSSLLTSSSERTTPPPPSPKNHLMLLLFLVLS